LHATFACLAHPDCTATPLLESDAAQLLMASATVLDAKKRGENPKAFSYAKPGGSPRFFFFVIYTGKGADNGFLGYFAVDKYTARVVNDITGNDVVNKGLITKQAQLQSRHCMKSRPRQ
jgi:hypothetical protein